MLAARDSARPLRALGGAGPVMLIGGAEDKVRDRLILSRFAGFSGGSEATSWWSRRRPPSGTSPPSGTASSSASWGSARSPGSAGGALAEAETRSSPRGSPPPQACSSRVGTSCGSQMVFSGTRLADAIHRAHDRGAVIAGTSAGASAMAAHMMAFGRGGETPAADGAARRRPRDPPGRRDRPALRAARALRPAARGRGAVAVAARHRPGRGHERDRLRGPVARGGRQGRRVGARRLARPDRRAPGRGHRPIMVSGAVVHSLPGGMVRPADPRAPRRGPGPNTEASE